MWVRCGNLSKVEILNNLLKDKEYRMGIENALGAEEEDELDQGMLEAEGGGASGRVNIGRKPGVKGAEKAKEQAKKREALLLHAKMQHALELREDGAVSAELGERLVQLIRRKQEGRVGLMVVNRKEFESLYDSMLEESKAADAGDDLERQFDEEDRAAEEEQEEEERMADEDRAAMGQEDEMLEEEEEEEVGEEEGEEEEDGRGTGKGSNVPMGVGDVSKETIETLKTLPSVMVFCNKVERYDKRCCSRLYAQNAHE